MYSLTNKHKATNFENKFEFVFYNFKLSLLVKSINVSYHKKKH